MQRQDPYEVLGVPKNASYTEIKTAYKKLILQFHPDKVTDETQKAEAEKKFIAVHEAYLQLTSTPTTSNATKDLEEDTRQAIADHIEQYEKLYDSFFSIKKIDKSFPKKQNFSDFDFSGFKKNFTKNFNKPLPYDELYLQSLTAEDVSALVEKGRQRYKNIGKNLDEYSYLWIAQKEGCAPIYIFNTMHIMLPTMHRFKDALENMIEKSDVVFTEIVQYRTSNSTLPSDYSDIDDYIAHRAYHMNKKLKPLENNIIRQACGLIITDEIVKLLAKRVEQLKLDYQNDPDLFESQILQLMLGKIDESNHSYEKESVDRNLFWMPSILHSSSEEKNATFVACGALHNTGRFGLPNLLRHEGYELKPVMKNPPTLTADALKKTLAQQSGLFAAKFESKSVSDDEHTTMKKKR